jgi:hypothetical protein
MPKPKADALAAKRRWRKPLTERGLRNAEKLSAILENATGPDDKGVVDAIASLAFDYVPRLLADARRRRQGKLL